MHYTYLFVLAAFLLLMFIKPYRAARRLERRSQARRRVAPKPIEEAMKAEIESIHDRLRAQQDQIRNLLAHGAEIAMDPPSFVINPADIELADAASEFLSRNLQLSEEDVKAVSAAFRWSRVADVRVTPRTHLPITPQAEGLQKEIADALRLSWQRQMSTTKRND